MIPIISQSPQNNFATLDEQFKTAWQFLKKTSVAQKKLAKLPWYLVIGPAHSGKSILITQAGLTLLETKNFVTHPKDETTHSKRCNWWFTSDGTLLDVPGKYLIQSQQLLLVLKNYIRRKPFSGVIITFDLTSFDPQNKAFQQEQLEPVQQFLYALFKQLKQSCPLYLLFTHTDRIVGFNDFFSDLGQEERTEIWGINFADTENIRTESLSGQFKTYFDQLIQRLSNRVVWRLHQERNTQKRLLIQHFPLQLDALKSRLSDFIFSLESLTNKNSVDGIYFTSSIQDGISLDLLQSNITYALHLDPLAPQPQLFNQSFTYFSQQLFKKIFTTKKTTPATKKHFSLTYQSQWLTYAGIASIVLITGIWMTNEFIHNVQNINAAEKALTKYTLLKSQLPSTHYDLSQVLPTLNQLQQSVILLGQTHLSWILAQGTHQKNLQAQAEKNYHKALAAYFLPCLGNLLQQPLTDARNPIALYSTLKTYLMLGDPDHFDSKFVGAWFKKYWQHSLTTNPTLQRQLEAHLTALLAHPFAPLQLNQQSILQARNILASASDPILTYAILKSNVDNKMMALFTPDQKQIFNKTFSSDNKNLIISNLYTAKEFAKIYFEKINDAVTTAMNGDWVLGKNLVGLKREQIESSQTLTQEVQTLYLVDYANHWLALLNSIHVIPWQTWQQGLTTLNSLLQKKSPFIVLLKIIATNTEASQLLSSIRTLSLVDKQNISNNLIDKFQSINQLLPSKATRSATLDQTLLSFNDLQKYLREIIAAPDSNKAAYFAAKNTFLNSHTKNALQTLFNEADNTPAPLQEWLNTFANNAWNLIQQHALLYLNKTWQTDVLSFYDLKLNHRYPLFNHASEDILPNDFSQFFGPNGILDTYVKNYLIPFIDMSNAEWKPRSLNGRSFDISREFLAQLERSGIIKTMYFSKEGKLVISFSLQALSIEPGVNNFSLKLNQKTISDSPGNSGIHFLTWPISNDSEIAAFSFTNNKGQIFSEMKTGPWALFKLIEKANLQPTQNSQSFGLTFDLDGNAARYQLFAEKMINPFIPDITDQFRCPAVLSKND